jgi:hypothetical protein
MGSFSILDLGCSIRARPILLTQSCSASPILPHSSEDSGRKRDALLDLQKGQEGEEEGEEEEEEEGEEEGEEEEEGLGLKKTVTTVWSSSCPSEMAQTVQQQTMLISPHCSKESIVGGDGSRKGP